MSEFKFNPTKTYQTEHGARTAIETAIGGNSGNIRFMIVGVPGTCIIRRVDRDGADRWRSWLCR